MFCQLTSEVIPMKIALLRKLEQSLLERLNQETKAEIIDLSDQISSKALADTEIILGWNPAVLDALKLPNKIKWIQVWSAGVDYLPLETFDQNHLFLTTASGANSFNIAQQLLAYLLIEVRHLDLSIKNQTKKLWQLPAGQTELTQKTITLLGTGNIAQDLVKMLQPFGMKIIGVNTTGHEVAGFDQCFPISQLSEAIRDADFVVNSLPLTTKTKGIIDQAVFKALKNSSYYLTVGRGKTTNEADLIKALANHEIAGAALDVFENEPLSENSPLWEMDNVLITPHSAGPSEFYDQRVVDSFLTNFQAYQETGIPSQHLINYQKEY